MGSSLPQLEFADLIRIISGKDENLPLVHGKENWHGEINHNYSIWIKKSKSLFCFNEHKEQVVLSEHCNCRLWTLQAAPSSSHGIQDTGFATWPCQRSRGSGEGHRGAEPRLNFSIQLHYSCKVQMLHKKLSPTAVSTRPVGAS